MTGNIPQQSYASGQGFVSSPRIALAQALMAQGASRAPVSSPLEGIARMLQAGIGGWVGSGVKKDQQDALADALKALEGSPDMSGLQRAKAAYAAYAAKSPDTPNPFEGTMLTQMVPKESWKPIFAADGKTVVGQQSDTGKREYFAPHNTSAGQVATVGGQRIEGAAPSLGEVADVNRAQALGTGQGQAQTAGQIESAKNPALIARAGGETAARAAAELPFVGPRAAETAAGTNQGQLAQVPNPNAGQAGAPPTVPGVQAVKQAEAEGSGTRVSQLNANAAKLRDDFNALPGVKNYREVVPIYQSMQDAAKRDNKAADLNIVYGLAKIMDPGSVVREGEIVMANDTQGLADKLNGFIRGIQGEGRLRPDVRMQLLGEAASRVGSIKDMHDQAAAQFTEMAKRLGANPEDVILTVKPPQMSKGEPPAQGVPRFKDDAASRVAYEKLAPGSAYYDHEGNLRFKPGGPQ